jgi:hypothetical protein
MIKKILKKYFNLYSEMDVRVIFEQGINIAVIARKEKIELTYHFISSVEEDMVYTLKNSTTEQFVLDTIPNILSSIENAEKMVK